MSSFILASLNSTLSTLNSSGISDSYNIQGFVTTLEPVVTLSSESLSSDNCILFNFITHVVFVGLICVVGFASNTLSVALLHKETSSTSSLIQATCIADLGKWIIVKLTFSLLTSTQ